MCNYTWGLDRSGRAYISKKGNNIILFCMIDGGGLSGVWILDAQERDEIFDKGDING